ncbi:DUF1345 domain-containing protein [Craterilacuibacter sp.]|uniref:DUF1345 domain-containing protein n=1 Tax=Craterilacuibacter sp. TaxID=2870909 RepID=UPI003F3A1FDE
MSRRHFYLQPFLSRVWRATRQFLASRPRLTLAVMAGVLVFSVLPGSLSGLSRVLLGWNVTAWGYLLGLWILVVRANPQGIHQDALRQDESAAKVLALVCVASLMSLAAIVLEMALADKSAGGFHLLLTGFTLLGAWLLLPTCFAIHYAHLFYLGKQDAPILQFPDAPPEPDYWDFLYFSFTIAAANQTADVAVASSRVRRLVLLQSILSFVFNLFILGLSINLGAGLIGR